MTPIPSPLATMTPWALMGITTLIAAGLVCYWEWRLRVERKEQSDAYDRLREETCEGWILLKKSHITALNSRAARYLGYDQEEQKCVGHAIAAFFPQMQKDGRQSDELWKERITNARARTGMGPFAWELRRKDGITAEYEVRIIAVPDRHSDQLLIALRDNAHQRMAAEAHQLVMMAVDNSPGALVVTDTRGNIRYVNRRFCTMTGYSSSEVAGRNIRLLQSRFTPRETYRELWDTITDGRTWQGEFQNKRKDGSIYWESASISPVMDSQGKIISFVAHKEDITASKLRHVESESVRTEIIQNRKMESVSTLAGGIAHDFNNYLAAIIGYAELIKLTRAGDATTKLDADRILAAACKARELVQQIQTFSGRETMSKISVDMRKVIHEVIRNLQPTVPSDIQLKTNYATGEYLVFADPALMHQAVLNLAQNAIHAMRQNGGQLGFSLSNRILTMHEARLLHGLLPGRYLELIVSDTGEGMSEEVLERIFDPFFSTKTRSEGTGMGLSVLHGIIAGHNGRISVESEPGAGSTFIILLPVSGGTHTGASSLASIKSGEGQPILLVDHHNETATAHARILEEAGYNVTVYFAPNDALAHFESSPGKYCAVLVDCASTDPDNALIVEQLRKNQRDLPIIVYTVSNRAGQDFKKLPADVVLLPKPAAAAELVDALQFALKRN